MSLSISKCKFDYLSISIREVFIMTVIKRSLNWVCFVLYCFIPIALQLTIFRYLWFNVGTENITNISLISTVFATIVTPVYLLIGFYIFNRKLNMGTFIFSLLVILAADLMGCFSDYYNWGIYTGYLYFPDSETVHLVKTFTVFSILLILLGAFFMFFIKKIKRLHTDEGKA